MNARLCPFACFSLLLWAAAACKPEPAPDPVPTDCETASFPVPASFGGRGSNTVWIVNEGNFQWGNAAIDRYEPETGTLVSGVFRTANQRSLGDVFQSMAFANGEAYLVINNSGRIEVANPNDMTALGTISGLVSPRYMLSISPDKAYVSDLYAQSVQVVNPAARTLTGAIPLPGWSEQMTLVEGLAWVANMQREYLYLIDPEADALTDSIRVGPACSCMDTDALGRLWVGCGLNLSDNTPGRLLLIDPAGRAVLRTYSLSEGEGVSGLAFSPDKTVLYFLNNDLFALAIHDQQLPACPLVDAGGGIFYGLGVDPLNGDIYVADAIDYVQRGAILRYRANGELVSEFRAGIIPGRFYFR